ncbi:MAG: hypothetical protein WCF60_03410 [Anaerobacillus sp.]
MVETICWILFSVILFSLVALYKYKRSQKSKKQREGKNPLGRTRSTEELRQNESKYKKADGGF